MKNQQLHIFKFWSFIIVFLFTINCKANQKNNYIHKCNKKLIEVVMEDVFNPPVASRVYMYPHLTNYAVLNVNSKKQLTQLPDFPALPIADKNINLDIAAEFAFTTVAKKLVFSEYKITDFETQELAIWRQEIEDTNIVNDSKKFGLQCATEIIKWIAKDNYIQVRTMERYVLKTEKGKWRPTAPEYTNALEPNWPKMRKLITNKKYNLQCIKPTPYSENKTSLMYKQMQDVMKNNLQLDTTQQWIASFWDCNPNISTSAGHITYFTHKVSPGGHWLKITEQACINTNKNNNECAKIYALVSLGIYTGFLHCWIDKYNYNTIRPETYIQQLMNPKWKPFIQTPPFPEYPSGHSVISNAAATILDKFFGESYSFIDSSEMYIDIAPRKFTSFINAAQEASISRFYGGIHSMPAITNGALQGRKIGEAILKELNN